MNSPCSNSKEPTIHRSHDKLDTIEEVSIAEDDQPERLTAGMEVPLVSSASSSSHDNRKGVCMICSNTRYDKPSIADRFDAKFLRPCFCGVVAHHGCVVRLLEEKKNCDYCGVKYQHLKYGSVGDYFKRYGYQYMCFSMFLIFFIVFFYMSASNSLVFSRETNFKSVSLTIIAVLFLGVIVGSLIWIVKYTVKIRIPRFRTRYGKVTIIQYNPETATKKDAKKSWRKQTMPENDITMQEVFVQKDDKVKEPKKTETQDLTLGQHMFGVCSTHQSCSTPINQENSEFVFNV